LESLLKKAKELLSEGKIEESLQLVKKASDVIKNSIKICPNCGTQVIALIKDENFHAECDKCKTVWGENVNTSILKVEEKVMDKKEILDKLWKLNRKGDPDADCYSINYYDMTGYLTKSLAIKLSLFKEDDDLSKKESEHKPPKSPEHKPSFDVVGHIMAHENGELDEEGTKRLFQHLVDSGLAWRLQGHYGRAAHAMIDAGHIKAPKLKKSNFELEEEFFKAKDWVSRKISYLVREEGKPQKQAVAMAINMARKRGIAKGEGYLSKDEILNTMLEMFKKSEEPQYITKVAITRYEMFNEIDDVPLKLIYKKAGKDWAELSKGEESAEELEKRAPAGVKGVAAKVKQAVPIAAKPVIKTEEVCKGCGLMKEEGHVCVKKVEVSGEVPPEAGGKLKRPRPLADAPIIQKPKEVKEVKKAEDNRPPKDWWDRMYAKIKAGNPDYTDEQISGTVGKIWAEKK